MSAVLDRGGAEELAQKVRKKKLGECEVVDSIDAVCRRCNAVAVLAPNFARVDIVEKIAESVKEGCELDGIICEKPLGRTVTEARRIVKLAREMNVPTAYFENQVHMPALRTAKSQLEEQMEHMGPIALARCTQEHSGPHSGWFWDPTRQGGGVLLDMGCHSIAVAQYILTPPGRPVDFLEPVAVSADVSLLKWGLPTYREQLKQRMNVDYEQTPAEDYCSGHINFHNPETGQLVKAEFANSWMYDKQGLRLQADGLGPGYALEMNTLQSPLEIFIGDEAAESVGDSGAGLEKATVSRGLMTMQPNEPDLLGFPSELADARDAILDGESALMDWEYGLHITRLCMAAYLSAERGERIDLTDKSVREELEEYIPLIAQGKGGEVL